MAMIDHETSAMDWFMNPVPSQRCEKSLEDATGRSQQAAADISALLSLPDGVIENGLCGLPVDDLARMANLAKSAYWRAQPLGQPQKKSEPTMAEIAADVTRTWSMVEKQLGLLPAGIAFFMKIFEIAPAALQLFSFRNEPLATLKDSPKLKSHALKVMQTVDVAVKGLGDLDKLVPVLQGLGSKHVKYGVLPVHYDVVGQALLATLEGGLGKEWTPEVEHAWTTVYGVVAKTMIGNNYS